MAEKLTANYGWTKPDPGASANTWGDTLNATTDKIDATVFVNQQGLVPVGTIVMFAGPQSKMPVNWVLCVGQSVSTTTYATLFALIGYTYGGSGANFNLPNFVARFPYGMTDGEHPYSLGGEANHALAYGEMPAHQHNVPDPQHYHTINQGSHTHGDYGHSHNVTVYQDAHSHGAYQDPHSHGGVMVPAAGYFSLAAQNPQITSGRTDAQQPAVHIDTQQPSIHLGIANGYANLAPSGTGVGNTDYAATRISVTDVQGSGAPHNNMPPYLQINFIIKYA